MRTRTRAQPPPGPAQHGSAADGALLRTATAAWYQDGPGAPLLRLPWDAPRPAAECAHGGRGMPQAVLFDRDGTLVEDVPHNTDPARVRPRPHAEEALALLRASGVRAAVVTNQPDLGHGLLTLAQLDAVHARMEELLGPVEVTAVCPHLPADNCACRKPAPGLVHAACRTLGVAPGQAVVVGDIGTDLLAAHAAGAPGLLVPNEATLPQETRAAPCTAGHLAGAVRTLLGIPARGEAGTATGEGTAAGDAGPRPPGGPA